jgi:DNA-binding GntR family transcriptional regulator
MGGTITCQTRHVSVREAPQDVAWALHLPCGAPIRVVRCVWVSEKDPAAVSTAYLSEPAAGEDAGPGQEADEFPSLGSVLNALPAAAVSVEMSPPQPSVARSLRLSPGLPVITVTVRFDDTATGEPAGLTVVMLKPELFRIAIDTSPAQASTPLAAAIRLLLRLRLGWAQRRGVAPSPGGRQSRPGSPGPVPGDHWVSVTVSQ